MNFRPVQNRNHKDRYIEGHDGTASPALQAHAATALSETILKNLAVIFHICIVL